MAEVTLSPQVQGALATLRNVVSKQHDDHPNEQGYIIVMTGLVLIEELFKELTLNTIVTFEQSQLLLKQLGGTPTEIKNDRNSNTDKQS